MPCLGCAQRSGAGACGNRLWTTRGRGRSTFRTGCERSTRARAACALPPRGGARLTGGLSGGGRVAGSPSYSTAARRSAVRPTDLPDTPRWDGRHRPHRPVQPLSRGGCGPSAAQSRLRGLRRHPRARGAQPVVAYGDEGRVVVEASPSVGEQGAVHVLDECGGCLRRRPYGRCQDVFQREEPPRRVPGLRAPSVYRNSDSSASSRAQRRTGSVSGSGNAPSGGSGSPTPRAPRSGSRAGRAWGGRS